MLVASASYKWFMCCLAVRMGCRCTSRFESGGVDSRGGLTSVKAMSAPLSSKLICWSSDSIQLLGVRGIHRLEARFGKDSCPGSPGGQDSTSLHVWIRSKFRFFVGGAALILLLLLGHV